MQEAVYMHSSEYTISRYGYGLWSCLNTNPWNHVSNPPCLQPPKNKITRYAICDIEITNPQSYCGEIRNVFLVASTSLELLFFNGLA